MLPVKWMPARSGEATSASVTMPGSPGTRLITPGGRPASISRRMIAWAPSIAVAAGFQIDTPPIRTGAVGRLPAIEVKLNGVTA